MTAEHPARAASQRSMRAAEAGDRGAWLANFADDAIIEDPIGRSPIDPSGRGHRGRAAIEAFWDAQIAPNRLRFEIDASYAAGLEVANVGRLVITTATGVEMTVEGVFTYRVDEAGKLVALRSYWELDQLLISPPPGEPTQP
ncbi:MAG: nuclear transport factor 2 family protein [Myxococcota bacterium]